MMYVLKDKPIDEFHCDDLEYKVNMAYLLVIEHGNH